MNAIAIIPARYASTRFPGKVLAELAGKPLIAHVYENAKKTNGIRRVILAIDDENVAEVCKRYDMEYVMTSKTHTSGTARCAEVARAIDADVIVNAQGDEPFLNETILLPLLNAFEDPKTEIATVIKRTEDEKEIADENVVKVVINTEGFAMYFSRATIPHVRNDVSFAPTYFKHIGVYAYRKETLLNIVRLPASAYERSEMLEQLRWLSAGYAIRTVETERALIGIDTPEDLSRAARYLNNA